MVQFVQRMGVFTVLNPAAPISSSESIKVNIQTLGELLLINLGTKFLRRNLGAKCKLYAPGSTLPSLMVNANSGQT